jgi:hypothetical protein
MKRIKGDNHMREVGIGLPARVEFKAIEHDKIEVSYVTDNSPGENASKAYLEKVASGEIILFPKTVVGIFETQEDAAIALGQHITAIAKDVLTHVKFGQPGPVEDR